MNQEEKFTETPIGWKWLLWAALVLPFETYVIYSTWETWPSLLPLAILGALTGVFVSFYVARHLTDLDDLVRRKAWLGAVIIESALLINAIVHGGGSRAYNNALVGDHERVEKLKFNAELESQHTANLERINRSESERAAAQAAADKQAAIRANAETRQTRLTGYRRFSPPKPADSPAPVSSFPPSIEWGSSKKEEAPVFVAASPAQVLERWFWPIFFGLIAGLGSAVVGGLLVLRETLVDRDGNGKADYRERQDARKAASLPSLSVASLRVGAPGAAPGGKPAVAQQSAPGGTYHPLAGTSAPGAAPTSAPGGNGQSAPGPHPVEKEESAPGAGLKILEPKAGKGYGRLIIGRRMPDIPDVEWEGKNSSGVIVAGWTPGRKPGDRRAPRLGQLGKTELAKLDGLTEEEFHGFVKERVEQWKAQKGLV